MGIAYGSAMPTMQATAAYWKMVKQRTTAYLDSTSYLKRMGHTAAVDIGVFLGLTGRVITTSSACTSASQGIGYGYEAIANGLQTAMIAGGADELCASEAAVFDALYASSSRNDTPHASPRPFDIDRDGVVVGEGAGTLILEELEHARARGANIHAEVVGFGTNSDGNHVTQPASRTMKIAMELALADAGLSPTDIGYINAHGTATKQGDIAESLATAELFGTRIPVSSLKSYMGHTLGACGALEAWMTIEMMRENWFAPTINLTRLDPECAELDYIVQEQRKLQCEFVMTNNFAFGGINTSLIFKRYN